jgi:cyclophilin family peptidyl-prolyl cis-trans isomerase
MNCELIQRRLLASDSPAQPSAETRRHLAECPACSAWHSRLVELEKQLPLLPVPPSERKAEVVRQILDAPEKASKRRAPAYAPRLSFAELPRERGLRKVAVAMAMAASLAIFALGLWVWQHPVDTPKPDMLKAYREERDRRLTQAPTRQAKIEVLATLAEEHHRAALEMAQQGEVDKLANASKFYVELVRDNLLDQARELVRETPPGQRPEVLDVIAQQLERTESSILRELGNPAVKFTNSARSDLQQMARAARTSRDELLVLHRG